jgi:hypothetical protein
MPHTTGVEYSPELADRICEELAGGKTLTEICRADGMPNRATIWRWKEAHEDFRAKYERAQIDQAHGWADEIIEIADDGRNDWMERNGKDVTPGYVLNGEHVQRSRVRIDTRKFLMSKIVPRLYGDRVQAEISGPDGGAIQIEDTALARWIALKLTAATAAPVPQLTAGD